MKIKCQNCETVFEGEKAKEEAIEHAFECVLLEYEDQVEQPELLALLQEKYKIKKFEHVSGEWDELDTLLVYFEDESVFRVYYSNEETQEALKKKIEEKVEIISKILEEVDGHCPEANFRFEKEIENKGTLGNKLEFSFTCDNQRKVETFYYRSNDTKHFVGRIRAYFSKSIEGTIEMAYVSNNPMAVNGTIAEEFLRLNRGKRCRIEILD